MTEHREEPILVEQVSGVEIIDDICNRIAEELGKSCHLRATDAYSGYSAKLQFEVQPVDIDVVKVEKTLVIGDHDPATPSRRMAIDVPPTTADEVRERSGYEPASLERALTGVFRRR